MFQMMKFAAIVTFALGAINSPLSAGEADVVSATATHAADGTYTFDVTVRHEDEGWDHYANRWDVMSPDGELLGYRVLAHPHVTEQPFTRRLGGVTIASHITEVTIRAHDSVHGDGGVDVIVQLPD